MSAISPDLPVFAAARVQRPLSLGVVGVLSSLTLVFPPFTYRTHRGKVPDWILDDRDLHGRMMQVHRVATGSWALDRYWQRDSARRWSPRISRQPSWPWR